MRGLWRREAYVSYLTPAGKCLQIDFGKFVTPHGAEVIETKDNLNYSRVPLFTYAIPFYHFGLGASYAFNDQYSLTGYAVNCWINIIDNNAGKTYGATLGWNPTKKWSFTQNYMAGLEMPNDNSKWRQLSDTVVTYVATRKVSLTANYDDGRGDRRPNVARPVMWTGVAGYVRYAFGERDAIATRLEYFDDRDGFATGTFFTNGTRQHFSEFTGAFERIVAEHLITRWEYRRDMSNHPVFYKGVSLTDAPNSVTAGLVYVCDRKEQQ